MTSLPGKIISITILILSIFCFYCSTQLNLASSLKLELAKSEKYNLCTDCGENYTASDLLDKYLYEKYHTKNILRISPFNLRDDAKEIKAERLKPIEEIPIPEPRDFTLSEKETLKGAWLSTSEGTNILFPDGTEDKQLKNFLQMSDYTPDDNTKVEITITYPDGYSNKLSTSVNELIKNDTQLNFWLDLYKLHSWFAPSNSIQDYYRYISFIIHFKLIDVGVIPIGPEKETNHER